MDHQLIPGQRSRRRPFRNAAHNGVVIAMLALLLTSIASSALAQEKLDVLRFRHPTNLAFSAPFQMLEASGALDAYASRLDVGEWPTPDILRSLLVTGGTDVTAVPSYVGANLANKGVDVKLAAVMVWGLVWVLGPDDAAPGWESLRGHRVMVPFRNDMPDLIFRHLAQANGLEPGKDFEVEYFAKPQDVVAQLVSGRGQWAVMPEHTATLALAKANENGRSLGRALDLQAEWAVVTGKPRIPQAGILVPTWLAEERPDLLGAVLDALTQSVNAINAKDPATVAKLVEVSGLPEAVIIDVIPRLKLDVVPAAEARGELEAFYGELASMSPDIIGGRLPDAPFYLEDPR